MKVGIFGGSFDPIHAGHTNLVRRAKALLSLDKVIVVPAYTSPFKVDKPPSCSAEDRLKMARLAFFDQKDVEVSDIEVQKGGISYTVDTVRELRSQLGKADELFLLLTEGQVSGFTRWKDYEEILRLSQVVILSPSGYRFWNGGDQEGGAIPWIEISSTRIRDAFKLGKNTKEFLSPKVLDYIETHNLYS